MSPRRGGRPAPALIAVLWLGLGAPAGAQGSSAPPVSPKAGLSVGVAPFERVGDVAAEVPDVSLMLARRLSTLGVDRVVGPREIAANAVADPDAATVAAWAQRGAVGALVVGRTTGLGGKLSVDARLRDGSTGEPIGRRFFVEVPRPRDLAGAVDQLASQVVEQANEGALAVAAPPPPAAAPARGARAPGSAASGPAREPAAGPGAAAASAGFDSGAPITIKSDVLDVFEDGGQRRFVFVGNVRAKQADLVIRSDRLESHYPPNGSQPETIVASGSVTMRQSGRSARCEKATFYRRQDKIVCTGDVAEVEQGCDVVRGREIEFYTASQVLRVNGAADVRINPEGEGCGKGAAAPARAESAPAGAAP
jgi:lipopolysaccharide transport protein LptA